MVGGETKQKGFSIENLWNYQSAIAVGIQCDKLFVLDIDGKTAHEKLIELGLGGGANTWTVEEQKKGLFQKNIPTN